MRWNKKNIIDRIYTEQLKRALKGAPTWYTWDMANSNQMRGVFKYDVIIQGESTKSDFVWQGGEGGLKSSKKTWRNLWTAPYKKFILHIFVILFRFSITLIFN